MASDVLMPQMGESIAEGTIVRWIKKVGDSVDRDEPLFEISTDKVDAEIPSPAAGVLTEIRAHEGETVPVNSVVAIIAPAGTKPCPLQRPDAGRRCARHAASGSPRRRPMGADHRRRALRTACAPPAPLPRGASAPASQRCGATVGRRIGCGSSSSPLVRRIAQEHQVDISQLHGTGISGRVTKNDILSYIESPSQAGRGAQGATSSSEQGRPPAASSGHTPATGAGLAGQTVPLSVMRRKIAEHMVLSKRTSAHVHTVFEVNFSRVDQIRKARKAEYEASGAKLTYLSFIVKAVVDALRQIPVMNASMDADNNVTYHRPVNVGIAVVARLGPHRPGDQERRREEPAWHQQGDRRPR